MRVSRLLAAVAAGCLAVFGMAVSASAAGNPIVNGGFETGTFSGWSTSGPSTTIVSSGAHSGSFAAMAGSTSETAGDSDIIQTFTAAVGDTTLSFWYNVTCADSVQFDWATATLRDNTSATSTTPLAPTCVPNSGWLQVTTAIMAGHSYTLTLTNHDDGCCSGDPTYTLFDDVAVTGTITGGAVRNSASGKCLNDELGATTPGNPIIIYTCISNGPNEQFSHPSNPGELIFSGQCLTDPSPGGSGTKQVIEPCTGARNQIWNHNSTNEYVVKFNGGCLTDPGGSKLNGTQVTVGTCKNVSNQHWIGP